MGSIHWEWDVTPLHFPVKQTRRFRESMMCNISKPKNTHMWHFLSCNLLFLWCQNLSTTWTVEQIGNWNKISHNLQEICSSHHTKWNWLLSGHEQFRGKIVNEANNFFVGLEYPLYYFLEIFSQNSIAKSPIKRIRKMPLSTEYR